MLVAVLTPYCVGLLADFPLGAMPDFRDHLQPRRHTDGQQNPATEAQGPSPCSILSSEAMVNKGLE